MRPGEGERNRDGKRVPELGTTSEAGRVSDGCQDSYKDCRAEAALPPIPRGAYLGSGGLRI
jgi:hypothetical protein